MGELANPRPIQAKLEEIGEKMREAERLRGKLARSLEIQELWPAAFEHGSVTSTVIGSPSRGYEYRVTRGDGSTCSWPIDSVPDRLWRECVPEGDVAGIRKAGGRAGGRSDGT